MRRGFTLVEVLMAFAILVVMAAALFGVQQAIARRALSTDHKLGALSAAHRTYEAIHRLLLNASAAKIPSKLGSRSYSEKTGAEYLLLPDAEVGIDGHERLAVNGKPVAQGFSAVRFYQDTPDLVSYAVIAGEGTGPLAARERAELYTKHFLEMEHDRREFAEFSSVETPRDKLLPPEPPTEDALPLPFSVLRFAGYLPEFQGRSGYWVELGK
jgi:prepilin-type N-terminal cleavage/methylation domain-containing protein